MKNLKSILSNLINVTDNATSRNYDNDYIKFF